MARLKDVKFDDFIEVGRRGEGRKTILFLTKLNAKVTKLIYIVRIKNCSVICDSCSVEFFT